MEMATGLQIHALKNAVNTIAHKQQEHNSVELTLYVRRSKKVKPQNQRLKKRGIQISFAMNLDY